MGFLFLPFKDLFFRGVWRSFLYGALGGKANYRSWAFSKGLLVVLYFKNWLHRREPLYVMHPEKYRRVTRTEKIIEKILKWGSIDWINSWKIEVVRLFFVRIILFAFKFI